MGRVWSLGTRPWPPLGGRMGGVKPDLDPGSRLRADQQRHATSETGLTLRLRFEETYIRRLTAVTIRWPQFSQHQE
jgi:hypothetical protein